MPDFKIVPTYVSSGNTARTWGEIWYCQAASLAAAQTAWRAVQPARLDLLHDLNKLVKIRISEVDTPRVTANIAINKQGTAISNSWGAQNGISPMSYNTSLVCNIVSLIVPANRKWSLRGGTASFGVQSSTSGSDSFSPTFIADLKDFFTQLAQQSFEVLAIDGTGRFPWHNIKQVGPSNISGRTTLVVADNVTPLVGSMVSLGSFSKKDLPALNGRYTVLSVVQNVSFDVAYVTPTSSILSVTRGRYRTAQYVSGSIIDPNASNAAYIASRKTKSPFTNGRGARSAARGLRLQA